jgi:hypothetical protein
LKVTFVTRRGPSNLWFADLVNSIANVFARQITPAELQALTVQTLTKVSTNWQLPNASPLLLKVQEARTKLNLYFK